MRATSASRPNPRVAMRGPRMSARDPGTVRSASDAIDTRNMQSVTSNACAMSRHQEWSCKCRMFLKVPSQALGVEITGSSVPNEPSVNADGKRERDAAQQSLDELFTLARRYRSCEAYCDLLKFIAHISFLFPVQCHVHSYSKAWCGVCCATASLALRISAAD